MGGEIPKTTHGTAALARAAILLITPRRPRAINAAGPSWVPQGP
jgi:hypothetical protein